MKELINNSSVWMKVIVWRMFIAIPIGTILTYLWFGQVLKSLEFMLFFHIIFTCIHYFYEIFWESIVKTINDKSNSGYLKKEENR